jgi:hypothetical protein
LADASNRTMQKEISLTLRVIGKHQSGDIAHARELFRFVLPLSLARDPLFRSVQNSSRRGFP